MGTYSLTVPPELHVLYTAMGAGLQITRLAALSQPRSYDLRNARPTHCLCGHSGYYHRVDSVIESPWQEIVGSKNFALMNLTLNFCETTIYDNEVFLENSIVVH